ncbi:MAG: hypothetical protein MUP97_12555 [Acidimicrobiia bacterium]|nr:hypothetical protein [Acidimicrobiia bacterium]
MGRRRHAAPGGRVLATGVGVSATLGIMAGFAVEARTVEVSTPTPTTAPQALPSSTTIVTRVVERTIYVPAGGGSTSLAGSGGSTGARAPSPAGSTAAAAPAAPGAPAAAPAPAAPPPTPPVCSGSKC